MKRLAMTLLAVLVLAGAGQAGPTLYFSTGDAADTSWTAYETGPGAGSYEIVFANIVVDKTVPAGANLTGDTVVLPAMAVTSMAYGITVVAGIPLKTVTASLTPIVDAGRGLDGKVYILDDAATGDVMMQADLGGGGMLSISTNYMAYSNPQNDLSNISYGSDGYAGYSAVIDGFVDAAGNSLSVDLSFSGDSAAELYNLLKGLDSNAVTGTISGQMSAIPAPGAIALGSLGAAFVGWLRRRRTL